MTPAELRRLLELAAKAAGVSIDSKGPWVVGQDEYAHATREDWMPNDDDGDSRRLQVALRIRHERHPNAPFVAAWAPNIHERFEEEEGLDPCAALRIAVLRAAAAIGEAMP